MTRCIAILTLALTAGLSAGEAFADAAVGGDNFRPQIKMLELNPGECITALRDADDLELLVAFVAYEYGTEAACEMLLDMGFSDREAYDIVLGAEPVPSVVPYQGYMTLGVAIVNEGGGSD